MRPIFKYGMAFCFALALGLFLYLFFGYNQMCIRDSSWTVKWYVLPTSGVS